MNETTLVKQSKNSKHAERIELENVVRFRCRREVPFFGRNWDIQLTMNEILSEPKLLFQFFGIKVTGSPGMHQTYRLYSLNREYKDTLLVAIAAAKKNGSKRDE
ncbi:MAG TPA: hypothetical protein VFE58_07795 [Tepidisphaeraceae bacterium]|nr:hypothetical protein [Tepidisphaeraceae bacterium]